MRMKISESQKKHLRGLGHNLSPLIMIGESGLSEAVYKEYQSTLAHHELIKVRVRAGGRKMRDTIIADLCGRSDAKLISRIGNIALIYRRDDEKPRILLPG